MDVVNATIAGYRAEHPASVPEVRIIGGEPPRGVAANFERALRACTGDLIALSDQDDVWHPDRLERLVAAFEEVPDATLLHSDARLVDADGADLGTTLFGALGVSATERAEVASGRGFDALLRRNLATGATTILRASVRDLRSADPARLDPRRVAGDRRGRHRTHGHRRCGAHRLSPARRQPDRRPAQPTRRRPGLAAPRAEGRTRTPACSIRAESLAERLPSLPRVSAGDLAAAEQKLAHERRRSRLPAGPPRPDRPRPGGRSPR